MQRDSPSPRSRKERGISAAALAFVAAADSLLLLEVSIDSNPAPSRQVYSIPDQRSNTARLACGFLLTTTVHVCCLFGTFK